MIRFLSAFVAFAVVYFMLPPRVRPVYAGIVVLGALTYGDAWTLILGPEDKR